MAKGLTVFIAAIVFFASLAVAGASAYGMGINNEERDSPAYKAALSFVIISSVTIFTTMMIISYHSTKLYCR